MKNILKILNNAVKLYDEHLNDNEFIFVFYNKERKIEYKKVKFMKNNFLHLTGVQTELSPKEFYKNLKKKRLKVDDIKLKEDGTTRLKLEILEKMHHLIYTPTIIGDYDGFLKINLKVDSVVGNTKSQGICMGLKEINQNNYVPKSLLKENVKHIVYNASSVLLTLKKSCREKEFKEVTYQSKRIDNLEKYIKENIDFFKSFNYVK